MRKAEESIHQAEILAVALTLELKLKPLHFTLKDVFPSSLLYHGSSLSVPDYAR